MKHFLDIDTLSVTEIERLIARAKFFKQTKIYPAYPERKLVTLFYENSTRTRVSFELAAKNLSFLVTHLEIGSSSSLKGESLLDTIKNLAAMGLDYFVIRHKDEGLFSFLAEQLGESVALVNAGEGTKAHPSQALLDLMTIVEEKPDLASLKVALIGNIRHSRVATSLQKLFAKVGIKELVLVAPTLWWPEEVSFGHCTESLEEGLYNADVVICLRIQNERLGEGDAFEFNAYRKDYALTTKRAASLKKSVMLMHPGPVNRGVEMDDALVDGERSFILEQVKNGVFMRSAILESLF